MCQSRLRARYDGAGFAIVDRIVVDDAVAVTVDEEIWVYSCRKTSSVNEGASLIPSERAGEHNHIKLRSDGFIFGEFNFQSKQRK
jgi:hypothetical protein